MDKQPSQFQHNILPKNGFEITVTVPVAEIKKAQDSVLDEEGKKLEIKGFRKGMAPKNIVQEHLGEKNFFELVLEKILPVNYQNAINQFNLKPIVSPKIELVSAKDGEDWQIRFTSCTEPEVNLGNYKEDLKKEIKGTAKIWTPENKTEEKPKDQEEEKSKKINLSLEWIIKNIKVDINDLVIEEELNRKLSDLLNQTQKLGITIDQYLASTGKTLEEIKSGYKSQIEKSLLLEFVLGKISDEENITVTEDDLKNAINKAKNEEERKSLENQKYYISVLLRRQKTLDFLAGL